MSTQHPLVPTDDATLATAHAQSPADTHTETVRRALALYALLENPDELLHEHGDPHVSADEIDSSRK